MKWTFPSTKEKSAEIYKLNYFNLLLKRVTYVLYQYNYFLKKFISNIYQTQEKWNKNITTIKSRSWFKSPNCVEYAE